MVFTKKGSQSGKATRAREDGVVQSKQKRQSGVMSENGGAETKKSASADTHLKHPDNGPTKKQRVEGNEKGSDTLDKEEGKKKIGEQIEDQGQVDLQSIFSGMTAEQLMAVQGQITQDQILALASCTDMSAQILYPSQRQQDQRALVDQAVQVSSIEGFHNLPASELQAIINGQALHSSLYMNSHQHSLNPTSYKNWWDEKDEAELLKIVDDSAYRLKKLKTQEMSWSHLEQYFKRSQNALRKKYWTLSKLRAEGGEVPTLSDSDTVGDIIEEQRETIMENLANSSIRTEVKQARKPRKKWTEEETNEMRRIVQDKANLPEMHTDEMNWTALAEQFNCDIMTAKRKYRSLAGQCNEDGVIPEKGKRTHHKKSLSYRTMIASAMDRLNSTATAPQIFDYIQNVPAFRDQLDTRIMPGTKFVERWKIQIRKTLSSDKIFVNTGIKQKHETLWQLDKIALNEARGHEQILFPAPDIQSRVSPIGMTGGQFLGAEQAHGQAGQSRDAGNHDDQK